MTDPVQRPTTSIRLNADERELLEAMAAYHAAKHGVRLNRSGMVKTMMRKFKPPSDEPGAEASRWRRAYDVVFGRGAP